MSEYRVERLSNGYIRIRSVLSGLSGLYNADGSYWGGDLMLALHLVAALIRR